MSIHCALSCHPNTPCTAVQRLSADVKRASKGVLALRYTLEGDSEGLRIPPQRASRRAEKLWEHTCFEAFVAADGAAGYTEFNFAPSTEWAMYAFRVYRCGMTPVDPVHVPRLALRQDSGRVILEVRIDLQAMPALRESPVLRVGLSAVVEDADGRLSYWALRHPTGKPDFHHADGFALAVRVEEPTLPG